VGGWGGGWVGVGWGGGGGVGGGGVVEEGKGGREWGVERDERGVNGDIWRESVSLPKGRAQEEDRIERIREVQVLTIKSEIRRKRRFEGLNLPFKRGQSCGDHWESLSVKGKPRLWCDGLLKKIGS